MKMAARTLQNISSTFWGVIAALSPNSLSEAMCAGVERLPMGQSQYSLNGLRGVGVRTELQAFMLTLILLFKRSHIVGLAGRQRHCPSSCFVGQCALIKLLMN